MSPADQCNFCSAPLRWLTSSTGAKMPVNAKPDNDRGNVVVLGGKAGVRGPARARAARTAGVELYLHHAVTCPDVKTWNTGHRPKPRPVRR